MTRYPRRRTRRNPRLGKVEILALGAGALALTSSSVRNAIGGAVGGLFHSVGTDVKTATGTAATTAVAATVGTDAVTLMNNAMAAGITNGTDPRSIPYGRALWASEHNGDPSGYDQQSQAIQVNWNNVAIHGH